MARMVARRPKGRVAVGAMAMSWMYAGRRWVATRDLCYLSVYWMTTGRYVDHMGWTVGINERLNRDHRVFQDRTPFFTAFPGRHGDRPPRSGSRPRVAAVLTISSRSAWWTSRWAQICCSTPSGVLLLSTMRAPR